MTLLQRAAAAATDALEVGGVSVPAPLLERAVQAVLEASAKETAMAAGRVASSAIANITDSDLEADYRRWWGESYGVPPNRQAMATAVAWGRQLVDRVAGSFMAAWGDAADRLQGDPEGHF